MTRIVFFKGCMSIANEMKLCFIIYVSWGSSSTLICQGWNPGLQLTTIKLGSVFPGENYKCSRYAACIYMIVLEPLGDNSVHREVLY